jgi:hypothetical protein
MNNAKIHYGEMVKKFIEETGAKLIYLLTLPNFPIFYSQVKFLLKELKARNYLDLIDAITDTMLQVTKKDIHNWFAHC